MTRAEAALSFLDRARETAPVARLRAWQWDRLAAGVGEVWGSNPFWRKRLEGAGFRDPRDLRTWDDFSRLPRLTKSELVADQAAHPPFGTNLTYPLDRYVRVHQTSGTTGAPLRWLDTEESWSWWARCWGFVFRGGGPRARATGVFFPFSFGLFVGFWAGLRGGAGARRARDPGRRPGLRAAAGRHARRSAPPRSCCTPSYALHLAEVARERGVDPATGSASAPPCTRASPARAFPRCARASRRRGAARAYDHAGMTEMGAYGFECAAQAGLHVNEARVHRRGDRSRHRRPVAPGEGELVLTNLGPAGARRSSATGRATGCAWPPGPCAVRPDLPPARGRHPRPGRRHADRPRRQRLPVGARGHRAALRRGGRVPDRGVPARRSSTRCGSSSRSTGAPAPP